MTLSSQVNRAELLHALQECHGDKQQLADIASLFGYEASENNTQSQITLEQLQNKDKNDAGASSKKAEHFVTPPLAKAQVGYHYLAYRERYASEEMAKQELPDCFEGITAITDGELTDFWESQEPINPNSLVQSSCMTPTIRHSLRQEVGKRLDVKTLVKQVAKQAPLKKIPTHSRRLPAGRVTVIADLNQRLVPFWEDIDEACELIKQKHGKIGLDIRVLVRDEPIQDYYRYEDWQQRKLEPKAWERIPAQSVVFILSDLGQLAPEKSIIRKRWLSFIQQLNRRGIKPLVLAPIAAEKQSVAFQNTTQLLLWQRFGRLKVQKTKGDKEAHEQDVERVLSFLSLSPHIEPELLRSFCELLPFHQGNAGIEADVYLHPHVQFGLTSISIKSEHQESYQQRFSEQPETLKQRVFECIQRHHSKQFASVWAETILNAEQLMPVDPQLIKSAEDWMLRFSKRYHSESSHDGMMRFARRHLSRLKLEQLQSKEYASAMHGLAYRSDINQGQAIPEYLDASVVNQVIRQRSEVQEYQIRQIGEHCEVSLVDSELLDQADQVGQVLATFRCMQKTVLVDLQVRKLPIRNLPLSDTLRFDTGQERFSIRSLKKPTWASAISMQKGYPIATLMLGGKPYELGVYSIPSDFQTLSDLIKGKQYNPLPPLGQKKAKAAVQTIDQVSGDGEAFYGVSDVGFDEVGLFADILFSSVNQRFRYIEPNTFMMGSPEDEKGRYDDEDLHQVALTQGYWLADTACTQKLWQAVMGDNPAEFKESSENPVEQVSWLDVQGFIAKLKGHLPELKIQLPTEAQWENACRAGTSAPFSFEGEINLDRVNYSGKWAEAGYAKKAKQKTQATKTYPVNSLGLYEMYGNVLEWCFDEWKGNLGNDSVIDPVQGQFKSGVKPGQSVSKNGAASTNIHSSEMLANADDAKVFRVLRGGSWSDVGQGCRSALRDGDGAAYRVGFIGFRLSLGLELQHSAVSRSDKAAETAEARGSEQTEQSPERRGAAQGLDQAESVSVKGMFDKMKNLLGGKGET